MNLYEFLKELNADIEQIAKNKIVKEINDITSTLETHIKIYENAKNAENDEDIIMAVIVIINCFNHCVNITADGYKAIDINVLKQFKEVFEKAKSIIDYAYMNIFNTINANIIIKIKEKETAFKCNKYEKITKKEVDYSRYSKEELIEMLRNK